MSEEEDSRMEIEDQEEEIQPDNFPRCSTPIEEPWKGPCQVCCPQNRNVAGIMPLPLTKHEKGYISWKGHFQHPKMKTNMKVRGIEISEVYPNTSMISGHFDRNREIPECFLQTRKKTLPPFYQTFYHYLYYSFHQPFITYATPNSSSYQTPMWRTVPVTSVPQMQSVASISQIQSVHSVSQMQSLAPGSKRQAVASVSLMQSLAPGSQIESVVTTSQIQSDVPASQTQSVAPIVQKEYSSETGLQIFVQPLQHHVHNSLPKIPQMRHLYYDYPAFMTNYEPTANCNNGHVDNVTMDNAAWISALLEKKA